MTSCENCRKEISDDANFCSYCGAKRITRERRKSLLVEYGLAQEMHNYYGRIVWQIGAILIGGGIAAFGLVVRESLNQIPTFMPSFFWLILTAMIIGFRSFASRYRHVSFAHICRCMEIEKELGLKQHTKARAVTGTGGWTILQILCIILIILTLAIALFLVVPAT